MKEKFAIDTMSTLEKETLLVLIINIVMEGVAIVFPNGKYSPLKWFNIGRWVGLGKLMLRIINLFKSVEK
jgi:hypothetical protein